MASFFFNHYKANPFHGEFNLNTDTIKVMLVGNTNVCDADDKFITDIATLGEMSITGYTPGAGGSGRKTLTGKLVTVDNTNDRGLFDCDDPTWSSITGGPVKAAIFYQHNSGADDSLNKLIAYVDDGGFPITIATDFAIIVNAIGLFRCL